MRTIWSDAQKNYLRKNIHLSNHELAEALGLSLASVENQVRYLGLARIFQKHEVETLKKVWGKSRRTIERALPRFNWRQISKKANRLGLPPLVEAQESVHLYSIAYAMGESTTQVEKWRKRGLKVSEDKAKGFRYPRLHVDIDDFWKFAAGNPDIVDITKLPEDLLGYPPEEIREMKKTAVPLKKNRKPVRGEKAKDMAGLYYSNHFTAEQTAEKFNCTVDTLRHAVQKHRLPHQKRDTSSVVTGDFLKKLHILYYEKGMTYRQCAHALNCSESSVWRGLRKLGYKNRVSAQNK